MKQRLRVRTRLPIRPKLEIEADLGTKDLSKPENSWLKSPGPWYVCKFRDNGRDTVPIERLARFEVDGAYDLEWKIEKPTAFAEQVKNLQTSVLTRVRDFYKSLRRHVPPAEQPSPPSSQ